MAVVDEREATRPREPVLDTALPVTKTAKRSPLLLELSLVAFLGWIYNWLQDLAPLRKDIALRHGQAILSLEERLGSSPERSMDHWLAGHHLLAYISSDFYDNAIFGVTFCFAAWIWWRRPDLYRPLRNTLVLANLAGFAVFWLYPVAPPRMLPGFVDVVERVGGLGSWHNTLISHADQLAAMPSMHLAWAVWCSLVAWRLSSGIWGRALAAAFGIAYPVTTTLVVLATGNHYLLDVLAGVACTVLAAVICEGGARVRRHQRRAGTRPVDAPAASPTAPSAPAASPTAPSAPAASPTAPSAAAAASAASGGFPPAKVAALTEARDTGHQDLPVP